MGFDVITIRINGIRCNDVSGVSGLNYEFSHEIKKQSWIPITRYPINPNRHYIESHYTESHYFEYSISRVGIMPNFHYFEYSLHRVIFHRYYSV